MQDQRLQTAFLRVGLGVGFLSAVADRLGLWGSYGRPNVAWGDMQHFLPYVGKLNPWFPTAIIPAVGWAVTIGETALGILLLIRVSDAMGSLVERLSAISLCARHDYWRRREDRI
jgi:hypothetical protein